MLSCSASALIETGLRFLESLAAMVQSTPAGTTAEQPIEQRLSSLVSHDPSTGRKTLSIPLPQLIDEDRLTRAIAGVLSAFERSGSSHLKELSNGRYTFAYNDKEFQVIDQWNGDDARSVNTLSGGESFLASLSLALALAESLAELNLAGGAVALESLFLDEGFSTLDAESQSRVADALQVLQGGKRLIGVITHVQALADQMPARIEIERTLSSSRVRQANG
jgi:exonuclease SbcC